MSVKAPVKGHIVVMFKATTEGSKIEEIVIGLGLKIGNRLGLLATIIVPQGTEAEWVSKLKKMPEVKHAMRDRNIISLTR